MRSGGGHKGWRGRRTAFHASAEINVFAFGTVALRHGGWDVATRLHSCQLLYYQSNAKPHTLLCPRCASIVDLYLAVNDDETGLYLIAIGGALAVVNCILIVERESNLYIMQTQITNTTWGKLNWPAIQHSRFFRSASPLSNY